MGERWAKARSTRSSGEYRRLGPVVEAPIMDLGARTRKAAAAEGPGSTGKAEPTGRVRSVLRHRVAASLNQGQATRLRARCLLRQLLGDAINALATVDFSEHYLRRDAALGPDHGQMIEEIRAFQDNRLSVRLDCLEPNLDGFLDELLGHLLNAVAKQPGGARDRRIALAGGQDRKEQTIQRITHGGKILPPFR